MKDIAVVIVNYNMKDLIEACLKTLYLDFQDDALSVEVLVVDNHSEDGVEDVLKQRFPHVRFVAQDANRGFGAAQNKGIALADAHYVFILNPDTKFLPGQHTLRRLYAYMEAHPKVGMIGPKIVYPDGSLQYSCWRFPSFFQPLYNRTKLGHTKWGKQKYDHHMMKDVDHNTTRPVDALMGSAMFVRKEALHDVGTFDERFWMYFEDIDLCVRMWEAGWPVYYVHDIVLEHLHGRGSAKIPGLLSAFLKNALFRAHVMSWLKYMWKWRNIKKYYA